MGLLKDQLEKLGLKASPTVVAPTPSRPTQRPAPQNHNNNHNHQPHNNSPSTQGSKNFCEGCEKVAPDVEYYEHQNRVLRAKWLCTRCADRFAIHDDFRRSAQSDFSKRRAFRREYGPTHSWNRLRSIMAEMEKEDNY